MTFAIYTLAFVRYQVHVVHSTVTRTLTLDGVPNGEAEEGGEEAGKARGDLYREGHKPERAHDLRAAGRHLQDIRGGQSLFKINATANDGLNTTWT